MTQQGQDSLPGIRYAMRVRGHLDPKWSELLGGWSLTHLGKGETLLTSRPIDQAALHGTLGRLRDFRIIIISLTAFEG